MFTSSTGNGENLEGVWNMQGDDSKEGRDSKRLSRAELLEMLIEQSKEVESLKKEVAKLQKQLDDRTIQLQQTGSIAEAALALNDIFKAADQAASQYIESIKRMEHEKNVEFQALRQKTLDACAVMREDTQEYCRRLRYESEAKRDALYAQLEKEKEEIEKKYKELFAEKNFGFKRLMKAFPDMTSREQNESLQKYKKYFNIRRADKKDDRLE